MPTTVTTVAASTTPLITNAPNVVAEAVYQAILSNSSITDSVTQSLTFGFNFKTDLFYNYAVNYYSRGVPLLSMRSEEAGEDKEDAIRDILEPLHGVTILDMLVEFVPPKPADLFLYFVQESPDYNLTFSSKVSLYAATYVTDIATGVEYRTSGFAPAEIYTIVGSNLIVDLPHSDASGPTGLHPNLQLNIPLNLSSNTYLYYVRYTVDTIPGYVLWQYNPDTNVYPELAVEASDTLNLTAFPIIPIRYNNENYVDYANEDDVKSLEDMLRFININLDEFTDNLTNPDDVTEIEDIDDMFLMFSADVNSNKDAIKQYLYEHFRQIKYVSKFDQQDYIDAINAGTSSSDTFNFPKNKFFYNQDNVRLAVQYHYISAELKGGSIGDPQPAYDPMVAVTTEADLSDDPDNDGDGAITVSVHVDATTDDYGTNHYIILRRQVDAGQFMEVVVHGLRTVNYVRNGNDIVIRNLATMGDGGMFIPLLRSVVKGFNGIVENDVYYASLNLTVYAVEETKLDWYENPNFIEAVGIFIAIVALLMGAEDVAALIAEGVTYTALAYEIAIQIIVDILYAEAFEEIVKLIGAENALILALVLAVVSQGSETGYFENLPQVFDAETLMKATTALIDAANEITKDDFLNLEQEYADFLEDSEEAQEQLQAAQDLLNTGVNIDLYTLISNNTYTNFYEGPSSFYERTIHDTNPGVRTFDSVHGFFDSALQLPNLT